MLENESRRRVLSLLSLLPVAGSLFHLKMASAEIQLAERRTEKSVGGWRVVSRGNSSRAYLLRDNVTRSYGMTKVGGLKLGGSAELKLGYWSAPGKNHGYHGALLVYKIGGSDLSGFETRVVVDGTQVDAFVTSSAANRDLRFWFGPQLDGLKTVKIVEVFMKIFDADVLVYHAELSNTFAALTEMRAVPDHNYGVAGLRESVDEPESRKETGSCILTTACCLSLGLSDHCWELSTLRKFRDNFLLSSAHGRHEVALYYALAPILTREIAACRNNSVYAIVYWLYILPASLAAHFGLKTLAHAIYRRMVRRLALRFCPPHVATDLASGV